MRAHFSARRSSCGYKTAEVIKGCDGGAAAWMRSDLEGRAGVAGSRRKVKRDDEVDAALWPQNERVGEVVGQAAVHHVDLFAFHIQRLVDAHKLVRVWKHNQDKRMRGIIGCFLHLQRLLFFPYVLAQSVFSDSESPVSQNQGWV